MTLESIRQSSMDLVILPGLTSYGKKKVGAGKLLRKPRMPRTLPPLTPEEAEGALSKHKGQGSASSPNRNPFADVFDMFDLKSEDGQDHYSPFTSGAPSLVSPPPSESVPTHNAYVFRSPVSNVTSLVHPDDKKYILDPLVRGPTSLGTYVDGKSLSKPFKRRGPGHFPQRAPKHFIEMLDYDCDDVRFFKPPGFTLEHFMNAVADKNNVPLCRVRELMYSRHNVKKLTDLLAIEKIHPRMQSTVNCVHFDPEEKQIPLCEPRVPQHQLLLEMAAMIKQHMRMHMQTDVRTVIKPAPKYSPFYNDALSVPHTEIILYEDDTAEREKATSTMKLESEAPGTDAIIHSARSRYFQDSAMERSHSPFAPPDDVLISPSELAILDSLIAGSTALSLKAHFIDALPDVTPLSSTLVYLNLSFNNFKYLPVEILDLWHLEVLKVRDNPLVELPEDIDRLRNLRLLVVSYCVLTSLPLGLFGLVNLQHLNVAYNKLTALPNEVKYLQKLEELNVEGNMLPALPTGILCMQLSGVRVKNNLMHPLFWKEHTCIVPQRLMDISMLTLVKYQLIPENTSQIHDVVLRMLRGHAVCDCCQGPRFGEGLSMIRPVPRLFGVKQVPIIFRSCSPTCLQAFRSMSGKQMAQLLYGVETGE